MQITINGTEFAIKFSFKAYAAVAKVLDASKFAQAEKLITEIGFDNLHSIIGAMLRSEGLKVDDDEVLEGLPNPKFGFDFLTKFVEEFGLPKETADITKAINEGN